MFLYRLAALLAVGVPAVFLLADIGHAQDKKTPEAEPGRPLLVSVLPAGAQIGQATEIVLTGAEVASADALLFSDPRITADKLGAAAIEAKDKSKDKMKAAPATGEVRFRVSVPAGVSPSFVDVRVLTPNGVSNPRTLAVTEVQELLEKEPNNDVDQAQRITVNTAVSGLVTQGTDVDYTVFSGKKGQHVVVSCLSSTVDSRLQADLQVFDTEGRPVGSNRSYRGDDAMLSAVLPRDGDYFVRVAQFTYTTGGPDHFYRLLVSSAPWIDAVYPPVVEPGQTAKVTVYGRNLPGGQPDPKFTADGHPLEKLAVSVTAPKTPDRLDYAGWLPPAVSSMDLFSYTLKNDSGSSNAAMLAYARAPVTLDNEANDAIDQAQSVTLPAEVVGRIEAKRDRDWYKFAAKKGEVVSVEAFADRLGSPVDLYYALYDAKGKLISEHDENPELLHPVQFYTRTEDPQRQRIEVPADGEYRLMVSTRESYVQSGARDIYRISVGPERPDFRLVVMPSAPYFPEGAVLSKGGQQGFSVFVWRMDGFDGPIDLSVEGLPKGVTCPPQSVGPRTKSAALSLSADKGAAAWAGNVRVIGKAKVSGKEVVREARSATITWGTPNVQQEQQPNSPTIARVDRSLGIAVRDPASFRLTTKTEKGADLVGSTGEKLTFSVFVERSSPNLKGPITLTVLGLPPGATLSGSNNPNKTSMTVTPSGDKTEAKVTVDLKKDVPAGNYSLVMRGQTAPAKGQNNNDGQRRPVPLPVSVGSEPLRLTVLPSEVAKLRVTPSEVKAKPGETVTLTVTVERLNDFDGPIKLELFLSDGFKGLSAQPGEVPAGKNEGMFALKVAPDVKTLSVPKLIIKGTARVGGKKDLTSEGRLSLTVAK